MPNEPFHKSTGELVECVCWCGKTEVKIPKSMVMDGQTKSCGEDGCNSRDCLV